MKTSTIVASLAIAAGIVAIPLYLKSSRAPSPAAAQSPQSTPRRSETGSAVPRFVDLGTTTCAPCRVMLGVMQELEQNYPDSLMVEFINVQERPYEADRYRIQVIPSQIFYAPDGRELYRHTGVFRADAVVAKWAELGFPLQRRVR